MAGKAQGRDRKRVDYGKRYPGGKEVKGQGEWFEFKNPGDELVGVFKGVVPFRNGHKGTILTDDGLSVFSAPTLLKAKLDQVEVGQRIAIHYEGEGRDTGKGNPLKEYGVVILPDAEAGG